MGQYGEDHPFKPGGEQHELLPGVRLTFHPFGNLFCFVCLNSSDGVRCKGRKIGAVFRKDVADRGESPFLLVDTQLRYAETRQFIPVG